ncbi:TPA: hypothetical protein ACQ9OC_004766 [Escherichia coli]|uniref:hypothetical protein n=1 Tax=Escherichia coli TaxID=562 RepID=UPI0015C42DE3|nr:hypothetical protein [Escherichia coli]NWP14643.1 hypothetical protein [Escherichia coli]HAJ4112881.1 hypothetical protein [Escherichia coli]HAJ4147260.1 hypothetical protein [Escherichia coli]
MLYFWVGLFTLMISILNYSVHMDAFLYMQKQKKIADEQAILEDVLTSSKYIGEIITENKAECSDFNKCTELLRNRLESNGYTVNNNVMHCWYNDKIITYYNYKFYDSVLSLYKKHGVQDLKTIDHTTSHGCNLSSEGVYIQKEYKDN